MRPSAQDLDARLAFDLGSLALEALGGGGMQLHVELREIGDHAEVLLVEVAEGVRGHAVALVRGPEGAPRGLVPAVAEPGERLSLVGLREEEAYGRLVVLDEPDEEQRVEAPHGITQRRLPPVVVAAPAPAGESARLHVVGVVAPEVVGRATAVEVPEPQLDALHDPLLPRGHDALPPAVVLALQELRVHVQGRVSQEGHLHVSGLHGRPVMVAPLVRVVPLAVREHMLDVDREGAPSCLRDVEIEVRPAPPALVHPTAGRPPVPPQHDLRRVGQEVAHAVFSEPRAQRVAKER
mmetsp:Transcript_26569/g.83278  ORF Transcript_26569/g.83278 Transcript_26569/m.83278 type:complete len:294 (+) Transcript_26569:91-972(+)